MSIWLYAGVSKRIMPEMGEWDNRIVTAFVSIGEYLSPELVAVVIFVI